MAYKRGTCYVCDEEKPVQEHHLIPLEYGGPKDGPLITICPTCHLISHYEAEIFYKTGDYGSLGSQFKGEVLKRAQGVIDRIVAARLRFEAHGKPAEDARRRVNINVSHEELLMLHALKRVLGFRSLERLVRGVLSNELVKQRKAGRI